MKNRYLKNDDYGVIPWCSRNWCGDTYAYDEEGKKTQAQREQKAAERLYGLLPEDQGAKLKAIWEEFEAKNTPESRFAHTMDNLQPVILNAATDGKAWKEHQVRLSQFMGRQEDTPKGSETLWRYEWEKLVKPFLENGTIRGMNNSVQWTRRRNREPQ